MPNPKTFQVSKEIIYLSRKLVENDIYVHRAVLDQILADWSERLHDNRKAVSGSSSKSKQELSLENKIAADLDYFCTRDIRMHADLADARLSGLQQNIDKLDQIRASRSRWPQSPNILFWMSSLEAVKGNWQKAITLIECSISLIRKYNLKGPDIDASVVTRLCMQAYYNVRMNDFANAQKCAFGAIAIAEDMIPNESTSIGKIKEHFITRDLISKPVPTTHLAACDVFIRKGDWTPANEKTEYFNFHWQSFIRAGGFGEMGPPALIAILSDVVWRENKPEIMADLSRTLFLSVARGSSDRVWRRTNLFLASVAAIKKGDMDVAMEMPFGIFLIAALASVVVGGLYSGSELYQIVASLPTEELAQMLGLAKEHLPNGTDVAGFLESVGMDWWSQPATEALEIPADVASVGQILGGDLMVAASDILDISSNGDTSDRLT